MGNDITVGGVIFTATSMRWDFKGEWTVFASWGPYARAFASLPTGREIGPKVISFEVTIKFKNNTVSFFPGPLGQSKAFVTTEQLAFILNIVSMPYPDEMMGELFIKDALIDLFSDGDTPDLK